MSKQTSTCDRSVAPLPWFRFYGSSLNDPALQQLPGDVFRTYVNLLCVALLYDGNLPPLSELAFQLRASDNEVGDHRGQLVASGHIVEVDGLHRIADWETRRLPSDNSRDRVRQHRERRNEAQNDSNDTCNVTVTEQIRQDHIKSEDSRRASASTGADRFDEFWEAYPRREGPNPKAPAAKKFAKLVKAGAAPDDIIAGAKRCAEDARKHSKENTPFVPMAVTWLNQDRWKDAADMATAASLTAAPPPQHGDLLPDGKTYLQADTPEWDAWCSHYRQHGDDKGRRIAPGRFFYGGWKFPARWPPGHTRGTVH